MIGSKLSPNGPHDIVDKLLMKFDVGGVQRAEIKQWRGFQRGPFGYNEDPTSSCHTFCWKARQRFDVPFFYLGRRPSRLHPTPRYEPAAQRCDVATAR
jgi:hypothetical protein